MVRGVGTDRRHPLPTTGSRDVDRHRVEAELPLETGHERRQQVVAGVGADVVDDPLHDAERVVTSAVHEAVDEALDPMPCGLGDQRDRAGRGDEEPRRTVLAEQAPEPADETRVHDRDPGRQQHPLEDPVRCLLETRRRAPYRLDHRSGDEQRHGRQQQQRRHDVAPGSVQSTRSRLDGTIASHAGHGTREAANHRADRRPAGDRAASDGASRPTPTVRDDGDQPGADLVGGAQHDVRDGRRHGERVGADPGVPRAGQPGGHDEHDADHRESERERLRRSARHAGGSSSQVTSVTSTASPSGRTHIDASANAGNCSDDPRSSRSRGTRWRSRSRPPSRRRSGSRRRGGVVTIGRPAPPRPPSTRDRRRTTSRTTSSDPPAPGLRWPPGTRATRSRRPSRRRRRWSTPTRRDCVGWATSSTRGRTAPSAFLRSDIRSYAGRGPGRMVPESRSVPGRRPGLSRRRGAGPGRDPGPMYAGRRDASR